MLFQNLNSRPAYPAPPVPEQAAPAVVPTAPPPPHAANIFSLPPVSPTCGDQIEVPMVTPGAQGPALVSPSKTQQGTQFGPRATCAAGQFPSPRYPVRGQGTPLDLRRPILISPQEPRVTLTVGNKLIDFLINTGDLKRLVNIKQRGNKVILGKTCLYL